MEFFQLIGSYGLTDALIGILTNVLVALGVVYIFGRMFNIAKTDISKNIIAFVVILLWSAIYLFKRTFYTGGDIMCDIECLNWFEFLTSYFTLVTVTCVFYVGVGFKLYPRMDHLLDKVIAPDEEPDEPKKRKRISKK